MLQNRNAVAISCAADHTAQVIELQRELERITDEKAAALLKLRAAVDALSVVEEVQRPTCGRAGPPAAGTSPRGPPRRLVTHAVYNVGGGDRYHAPDRRSEKQYLTAGRASTLVAARGGHARCGHGA